MRDKSNNDGSDFVHGTVRTVLFPNSSISGKLSYDLPVKIDSRFTGELKATELLVIGSNARVDAYVFARQLQLEGKLTGNVQVMGCFEILPGGEFQGEVKAAEIKIHCGAVFEGRGQILGGS
ncbi:MAG: polymer-forming cytoskeletal protein [Deltaproteobacteria bacterium]|nr:polymer-forming cytoskeletal protein [Deltaproteobacteria bacterium]